MSKMMRCTDLWFTRIDFAICFKSVVLPAFGCDTIMPRWPLPMGENRSTILVETPQPGYSSLRRS